MSGFDVEPGDLDKFAELLMRYSEHSSQIAGEAASTLESTQSDPADSSSGFVVMAFAWRTTALAFMHSRLMSMRKAGTSAAQTLRQAADWYRDNEDEAAKLDETYEPASGELVGGPAASPEYDSSRKSFGDAGDPIESFKDVDTKVSDLEPKANSLEEGWRDFANRWSVADEIRILINECGFDVDKWVIEPFTGRWETFARWAITWEGCSQAVETMSANVGFGTDDLSDSWSGNAAADAALYFDNLAGATATEAAAFAALAEYEKTILETCYQYSKLVDDSINVLIDTAFDALLVVVASTATPGIPEELAILVDLVREVGGYIITAVTTLIDLFNTLSAMASAEDLDIPPSDLQILNSDGKVGDYEHPEVK